MKRFLAFLFALTTILLVGCKKEPYLSVTPDSLSFPEEGGSKTVMISANYPWTVSTSGTGFTVSPTRGEGDATVTVTAAAASSPDEATGSLSIRSEGLSASVKLTQESRTTVSVGSVATVPAEGGVITVDVQYNTDFDVEVESSARSWLTFNGTKALSSGKLEFTVAPNESTDDRSGTVTVKDKSGKASPVTITVRQNKVSMAMVSRRVLTDLYNALGGSHWKVQGNWATDAELSKWEGVTFNNDIGGVTEVIINDFGLKGEIPQSIGDLTCLKTFRIENEPGVTGTLPASFGNLVNLESLSLNGTSLTSLPDIFSKMTKLRWVFVNNNVKMTGPIPASLGAPDEMSTLSLIGNHFTGTVPDSWAKHYKILNVAGNYLSGTIPPSFLTGDDVAKKLQGTGLLLQGGEGFDISGIEIPGYWPEGNIQDIMTGKDFNFPEVVAKNKYTVFLDWAPWCPFSKALLPQLLNYYKKYHKDGLEIIASVMVAEDGSFWDDLETQKNAVKAGGYDQWINFFFGPYVWEMSFPASTPQAEIYDHDGNTVFSSFSQYPDPVRKRFSQNGASVSLIPFLETLFGPANTQDNYVSSDYSKDGEVLTLQKATVGKGINIVFLGDGYSDRHMGAGGLYETVMKQAMEEFFAIEPYKSLRNRFNVYAVKVVSKNEWIGDGYTTALGSSFGSGSEVYGDDDKCYAYALKVPGISDRNNLLVNVLINTTRHAGLAVMSVSTQSGLARISSYGNEPASFGPTLRHESGGHGFAFLDDEYIAQQGAASQSHINDRTDKYTKYGWFANVDFTSDAKKVKWSAFLSDDRYKNEVGVFEGAYYGTGAWRPSANSMMKENVEYFNAPSRWAIYQRIMKLSGEDYSFAKFLEYDAVNRGATKADVRPPLKRPDDWQPGAPPVIVP